jgi:hypothetical protein
MITIVTDVQDPHGFEIEAPTTRMARVPVAEDDGISDIIGGWPFHDVPDRLASQFGTLGYYLVTTSTGYAAIRLGQVPLYVDYAGDAGFSGDGMSMGWCWPLGEHLVDLPVDDVAAVRDWARTRVPILLGEMQNRLALARIRGRDLDVVVFGADGWRSLATAGLDTADLERIDRVVELCTERTSAVLARLVHAG